jgi:hypothetical protein
VVKLQTRVRLKKRIQIHRKLNMCSAIFYNLKVCDLVMP